MGHSQPDADTLYELDARKEADVPTKSRQPPHVGNCGAVDNTESTNACVRSRKGQIQGGFG